MVKTVLALKRRDSSVLANQVYGEKLQRSKPENQSILGSHIYGKEQDIINEGKMNTYEKTTYKNKQF